jgi:hypothetical protein
MSIVSTSKCHPVSRRDCKHSVDSGVDPRPYPSQSQSSEDGKTPRIWSHGAFRQTESKSSGLPVYQHISDDQQTMSRPGGILEYAARRVTVQPPFDS